MTSNDCVIPSQTYQGQLVYVTNTVMHKCYVNFEIEFKKKVWGWLDVSVFKKSCCSCKEVGLIPCINMMAPCI